MKIALDSNVLLYLARVWKVDLDREKTAIVKSVLRALTDKTEVIVPYQVLGECFNVMHRHGFTRERSRAIILRWTNQFPCVISGPETFEHALDLATEHKLQFWDALILSAAADAGCSLLLSEELQAGFTWRGVRVVDPFAKKMDVRLKRVIKK